MGKRLPSRSYIFIIIYKRGFVQQGYLQELQTFRTAVLPCLNWGRRGWGRGGIFRDGRGAIKFPRRAKGLSAVSDLRTKWRSNCNRCGVWNSGADSEKRPWRTALGPWGLVQHTPCIAFCDLLLLGFLKNSKQGFEFWITWIIRILP